MHSVEEFFRAVSQRVQDLVELAEAETRLAALSGLTMIFSIMIAAVALVVAWGLLVACVLFVFSRTPLGWPIPAFIVALGHVALAYFLWQYAVRLSRNLTLPELRTSLRGRIEPQKIEPQKTETHENVALVAGGS
ncbi:MAG TPA: phage holin family protein [Gammaproteobacteria bacterium]|nr:phage holin family protein [Gammaproteobacteria bacterium]